jgi:hypothetical protein
MTMSAPNETQDVVYEAVDLKKSFDDGKVAALRGVNFQIAVRAHCSRCWADWTNPAKVS